MSCAGWFLLNYENDQILCWQSNCISTFLSLKKPDSNKKKTPNPSMLIVVQHNFLWTEQNTSMQMLLLIGQRRKMILCRTVLKVQSKKSAWGPQKFQQSCDSSVEAMHIKNRRIFDHSIVPPTWSFWAPLLLLLDFFLITHKARFLEFVERVSHSVWNSILTE